MYDERTSLTEPRFTEPDFFGDSFAPDHIMDLDDEGDGFRRYNLGTSGNSSQDVTGVYVSGFAVCSGDWCGPYRAGEGS